MKKLITLIMAAVLAVTVSAVPVSAANTELQTALDQIVAAGYPGAWAKDSRNGHAAAGVADLATQSPATSGMKMRIGSVTKTFVSATALKLVDQNQLSLNDTVEQWVPGLLPYGSQVTVRQLLQHTAGIPDYLESGSAPLFPEFIRKSVPGNPEYDPAFKSQTWTPQALVQRVSSEPRHTLPPNQAEYSNTNYIVLGLVIEAASGQPLRQAVQQRIIGPLNLNNTSFPQTTSNLEAPYGHGYTYNIDPQTGAPIVGTQYDITHYNPSFLWAAGGMVSNPNDLNKFLEALMGGQVLSANLTAQMKQAVPFNFPIAGVGSGLGIWVWDLSVDPNINGCNKTIYGHEGEAPGYNTFAFANDAGGRAITLEANLLVPDWENQFFAVTLPAYVSLWCNN